MKISIVVAHSANNVIGKDGGLPWHLPEDLKRFKALTMGKPIVMGRLTHESIGRALPGRQNIVITGQSAFRAEGCDVVSCPADALQIAAGATEVMVIGGGHIYAQFLRRTDRIYRTLIEAEIAGDTFFPELATADWHITASEVFPENADRKWSFVCEVLDRNG
ncbi:MAG: dihydrofolate reductase [Proteobacteria bacterium]|nr:dihydrofolate reductase [Pseudomonadota bacterium]